METPSVSHQTLRIAGILLGASLLSPVFLMVVTVPMVGSGTHQMGTWGMSLHWAVMMGFCLLLVGGLVYVVYRFLSGKSGHPEDPALGELRLAYARGDVPEETYQKRREVLEQDEEAFRQRSRLIRIETDRRRFHHLPETPQRPSIACPTGQKAPQ